MAPKRPNELNFEKKIKLINDYKNGGVTQKQLSENYKVAISTVSKTIKDATKYLNEGVIRNKKCKRIRSGNKFEALNEKVHKFIQLSNANEVPVSGPIIQSFASNVATRMNLAEFTASKGWLQKLTKRYDIRYKSYSGESADVSEQTINDWKAKIPELTANYKPEDVFNFDETGLFYKLLPKKSYFTKDAKRFGGKKQKQRVTVGLCCSSKGEKLKPLIIGIAKHPRCFSSKFNINSLGVDYYHNKTAWMTQPIFDQWLAKIDKYFRLKKRRILLFVDNCSAHETPQNLKNVKVEYLPPNATSRLQPIDQGIIKALKSNYRKLLIKYLAFKMSKLSESLSSEELRIKLKEIINSITLKDGINWLTNSWDAITESTIRNCFTHSGFNAISDDEICEVVNNEDNEVITEIYSLIETNIGEPLMSFDECYEFENNLMVTSNDWQNDLLEDANEFGVNDESGDEIIDIEDNIMDLNIQMPTFNETIEMINRVEAYVLSEVPEATPHLFKVKNLLIDSKQAKTTTQKTITDYFK